MPKSQKITLSASSDIPFNKLVLSQANVRRVKAGVSIEELAEDIARRTLLASLTVRPVENTAIFSILSPPTRTSTRCAMHSTRRAVSSACRVRTRRQDRPRQPDRPKRQDGSGLWANPLATRWRNAISKRVGSSD